MLEERIRKHWDPLVKQTYSVWVEGPRGRRKWHLTAYFTQATVDRLQTVDDFPQLAGLDVPPGKYVSTRLGKPRRMEDANGAGSNINGGSSSLHDVFRPANVTATRTYAPFPLPYQVTPPHHSTQQNFHDTYQRQQHGPEPPHSHSNGFDYSPQHQISRIVQTPGESSRQFYAAPSMERQPADYSPDIHSRGYPPQYDNANPSLQPHYLPYPPPADHHRATLQLPTPTSSSSHSSPVYSPHEHPNNSVYGGPLMMSYSPPAASSSMPPLRPYRSPHTLPYTYTPQFVQERQPPQIIVPPQMQSEPPSPSNPKSPESASSPRRPTLTLPPHLASRFSPPVSDARDEHGEDTAPQSPRSAASSSCVQGGKQLNLAPLRTLVRAQAHPYRRDKFDDKALMAFTGRKISE
ncbi:hypothetical protein EW145_g4418 [Phellinidium pouzarii]|uniref:Uncharacterized protein n=1 Tax=Phellinidium pouzarii TaxID=167371 RepID=A0A4S4L8H3_9AGAM|nr:hypothetical protein EW145_g4418 [Phellinidium pouzarii]